MFIIKFIKDLLSELQFIEAPSPKKFLYILWMILCVIILFGLLSSSISFIWLKIMYFTFSW